MLKTVFLGFLVVVSILIGCGENNQSSQDTEGIVTTESPLADSSIGVTYGVQRFMILEDEGDSIGFEEINVQPLGTDSLNVQIDIQYRGELLGEEQTINTEISALTGIDFDIGYCESNFSAGHSNITDYVFRHDSLYIRIREGINITITDTLVVDDKYIPFLYDFYNANLDWESDQRRYFHSCRPFDGTVYRDTSICLGFENVVFLEDTVLAAKIETNESIAWVWSGQVVKIWDPNKGITLVRIPFEPEEISSAEPVFTESTILRNSDSDIASEIRTLFPEEIELADWFYPLDEISCVQDDIANINVTVSMSSSFGEGVLEIAGSITVGSISTPFSVYNGANGEKYMLSIDAILFSPYGNTLWSQSGYPRGGSAWVNSTGFSGDFTLIKNYNGDLSGNKLVIIASGDPIESPDTWDTRVILGVYTEILD